MHINIQFMKNIFITIFFILIKIIVLKCQDLFKKFKKYHKNL